MQSKTSVILHLIRYWIVFWMKKPRNKSGLAYGERVVSAIRRTEWARLRRESGLKPLCGLRDSVEIRQRRISSSALREAETTHMTLPKAKSCPLFTLCRKAADHSYITSFHASCRFSISQRLPVTMRSPSIDHATPVSTPANSTAPWLNFP